MSWVLPAWDLDTMTSIIRLSPGPRLPELGLTLYRSGEVVFILNATTRTEMFRIWRRAMSSPNELCLKMRSCEEDYMVS